MSVQNKRATEGWAYVKERREALALETFKIDRVMQMLWAAFERGEERITVEQKGEPKVELQRTKAAAVLIEHLAKLGYCCAWVEVATVDPVRIAGYHELVVSAREVPGYIGKAEILVPPKESIEGAMRGGFKPLFSSHQVPPRQV